MKIKSSPDLFDCMQSSEPKIEFPLNPFPDVSPNEFNKLNKKGVTEDYVSENFRAIGWQVFEPFTDSGIDRILSKKVCPHNHTKIDEILEDNCTKCNSKPILIYRFCQVKTRTLKNNVFGFTLKSKDFRSDPRHTFIFYSDTTNDFLIVGIYNFLFFFDEILKSNPFATKSFRKGNYKINNLKYKIESETFNWQSKSWESFRNLNGLLKLQNPTIDNNLFEWIKKTKELQSRLFYTFRKGKSYSKEFEELVNVFLQKRFDYIDDPETIIRIRENADDFLRKNCSTEVIQGIDNYFATMKDLSLHEEDND